VAATELAAEVTRRAAGVEAVQLAALLGAHLDVAGGGSMADGGADRLRKPGREPREASVLRPIDAKEGAHVYAA
jgi:hypothetical protein